MGTGVLNDQTTGHQWQVRHVYLFRLAWVFVWLATLPRKVFTIVFATWPSMHDPIKDLLNAAEMAEADRLTDKWTDGKLKELQYVGLSVRTFNNVDQNSFLHARLRAP